jgi:hypothetical protein
MVGSNGENTLWKAVQKCEKILLRILVFCFIALIVAQSLLTSDPMRFYLSWAERIEGEPLQEWSGSSSSVVDSQSGLFAHVTLELKDYSSLAKANLLVNQKKVADFRQKQITIRILPGDIIEIDGSFYNQPINFEITKISPNIIESSFQKQIRTNSNVVLVGKVEFK